MTVALNLLYKVESVGGPSKALVRAYYEEVLSNEGASAFCSAFLY